MTIKSLKNIDPFSQSPIVTLLPVLSQVDKLKDLKSFFYARYEKVAALREGVVGDMNKSDDALQAEYAMLLEILDWLKITPAKE